MRTRQTSFLLLTSLILLGGCSRSWPEAYGIYADTNKGRLMLQGQPVLVAGTILSSIPGVKGPSGAEGSSVQDFIIYRKDVPPESVGVVRLDYARDREVAGFLLRPERAAVNLWVPKDRVEVDVKPVEDRRDMYVLVPRKPLDKGFYALYFGGFGGDFGMGAAVYDIVVGSIKDFPSYQSRLEELKSTANDLIAKMNRLLNQGNYSRLEEVYRPDGRILSGDALQQFVEGNKTWLGSSGKVLKSEIKAVTPSGDNSIVCSVITTYEKLGPQQETLTLTKLGSDFFITHIQ